MVFSDKNISKCCLTRDELIYSVEETRLQIYRVRNELNEISDSRQRKQLQRKLKELQIRQLWNLEQLGW
jgi:hypothetical protein